MTNRLLKLTTMEYMTGAFTWLVNDVTVTLEENADEIISKVTEQEITFC